MKTTWIHVGSVVALTNSLLACQRVDMPVTNPQFDINYPAAFVVNGESNAISVLDLSTQQTRETISLGEMTTGSGGHGGMGKSTIAWPHHIYLSPDGNRLALGVPGEALSAGHAGGQVGMPGRIVVLDTRTGELLTNQETPAMNYNLEPWTFSGGGETLFSFFSIQTKSKPTMNSLRKTACALGLSLFAFASTAQNIQPLLTSYYEVKDALVATDASKAKTKATDLLAAIGKFDTAKLSAADKKALAAAKTEASHIGESTDVKHQREHFEVLSQNVIQLTKSIKPAKTYVQFCPMAADGKGAYWLSDKKAVRNPYYGAKMLTCGKVTEEI